MTIPPEGNLPDPTSAEGCAFAGGFRNAKKMSAQGQAAIPCPS
jgi:hypothetical protein